MRQPTLALALLAFSAGLLLRCELGAPVQAEPPPADGTATTRSGTRLLAIVLDSQDGARIPTGEFWDVELEERCRPALAADGVMRCLPGFGARLLHEEAFATEDCSGEARLAATFEPEAPSSERYFSTREPDGTNPVYSLLRTRPGESTFYSNFACISLRPVKKVLLAAEHVQPATFAEFTPMTLR